MSWEFKKEKIRFYLFMAFYSFTNFFDNVSRKKSNKIKKVKTKVTQTQSFHIFNFGEPILLKIISDGYGAYVIRRVPLFDPNNSPT